MSLAPTRAAPLVPKWHDLTPGLGGSSFLLKGLCCCLGCWCWCFGGRPTQLCCFFLLCGFAKFPIPQKSLFFHWVVCASQCSAKIVAVFLF